MLAKVEQSGRYRDGRCGGGLAVAGRLDDQIEQIELMQQDLKQAMKPCSR